MAFDRPATRSPRRRTEQETRRLLEEAIARHDVPPLSSLESRFGRYRGYAEILREVLRFADRGARILHVGESVRGEPLFGLAFGDATDPDDLTGPDPTRRTSVVVSGLHPMEWIGIETHLRIAEHLLGANLDDRMVLCFPLANPDGFLQVEDNLRAGRSRFVRHNARRVDLNRNFPASWGKRGLARRLLPGTFAAGTRPLSEPETEAIAHELADRRVDRALSLHSFGGAVLYPKASSRVPIHDAAEHRAWARSIARQASPVSYRALSCAWFGLGFRAFGLELDWFHERHGALSLLIECSRGGLRLSPSSWTTPFAWYNPKNVEEIAGTIAHAVRPYVGGASLGSGG